MWKQRRRRHNKSGQRCSSRCPLSVSLMEPICLALSLSLSFSLCLSGSIYGGAKSKERNRTKASVRQKRRSATAMAIRLVSLCNNCPNGQIDIHRSFRNHLKIKECKSNRFLQQQLMENVNFFVRQSGMDSMEILRSDQPCTGLSKRNGAKLRESFCPAAASHSRPGQAGA